MTFNQSEKHRINTGDSIYLKDIGDFDIQNAADSDFINGATTLSNIQENKLLFIDNITDNRLPFLQDTKNDAALFIIPKNTNEKIAVPHIKTDNPRIAFATLVSKIFDYPHTYFNSYYSPDELIDTFPHATVMPGCHIHKTAKIGKNSLIMPNVTIGPHCVIGNNVIIKSGTVIGLPGFGVIHQDNLEHVHLPHIGGVIIDDNVELGSLNTVCSGTIHPTIIESYTKTDDIVHIAHNCHIKKGVIITAQVEISGSVTIEQGAYIGPNTSIIDQINIGENAFIGIGSNVIKPVVENAKVAGNPARCIKTKKH